MIFFAGKLVEEVFGYRSLVCPSCGTLIQFHPCIKIGPGNGTCPKCEERFWITFEIADKLNGRIN